jgi:hypothetical protein
MGQPQPAQLMHSNPPPRHVVRQSEVVMKQKVVPDQVLHVLQMYTKLQELFVEQVQELVM